MRRASSSSSATVSARHSTTTADRTAWLRAKVDIAPAPPRRRDEQPTVAILGKAGQAIQIGDGDAGFLERLDERIGEPLRELVERHQPGGARHGVIFGGDRVMAPHVAERDAGKREAPRPDRVEGLEHGVEDPARRQAAGDRVAGEHVEEPPEARGTAEQVGALRHAVP